MKVSPVSLLILMVRNQPEDGTFLVSDLAEHKGVSREDIYETLSHLLNMGLCHRQSYDTYQLDKSVR